MRESSAPVGWAMDAQIIKQGAMMAYYVNEDKPTSKTIIHRDDDCCEVPREKQLQDGRWHGPFNTKDETMSVALDTSRGVAKECGICLSGHGNSTIAAYPRR